MAAQRRFISVWQASVVMVTAIVMASPGVGMTWSNIGPPGGQVEQVAVAGPEGKYIYAMTAGGNLWASVDGAVSFEERARERLIVPGPFVVDPADPAHLWIVESPGVLESWDGGRHWKVFASFPAAGWVGSLIIDPWVSGAVDAVFAEVGRSTTHDGTYRLRPDGGQELLLKTVGPLAGGGGLLYSASGDGVLRSTDGTRWETVTGPGVGDLNVLAVDEGDGQHVLAGGQKGLAVTLDGGATWRKTPVGEWVGSVGFGDGVAWCITSTGLWISTSDGLWWDRAALSGGRVACAAADPSNPGTVYVGTQRAPEGFDRPGLMRSVDYGRSFRMADTGIIAAGVARAFPAADGAGPALVVKNDAGLLAWEGSGAPWRPLRPNGEERVTAFCRDPSDGRRLFATSRVEKDEKSGNALFVSDDGGRTWRRRTGLAAGQPSELAADPFSPNLVFGIGWPGVTVFHLDDGTVESPYGDGTPMGSIVAPEAFPGVVVAGGWSLWRSEDSGATWQTVEPSTHWDIQDLEASAHGGLYLVSEGRVFRSTDGGSTWTPRGRPRGAGSGCRDLAVSPGNPNVVVMACSEAATGWGVFLSGDGGAHWQPVAGPQGVNATTVDFDPSDPGSLLVGTEFHGVWRGPVTPTPRAPRSREIPARDGGESGRTGSRRLR